MSQVIIDNRRAGKRLRQLVLFATAHGWTVNRTRGGHIRFTRQGFPPVFTSSTPSDHRANLNALAQLRRAERVASRG